MGADLVLAQTLCARLCHDLGGAVGTVAGALELAGGDDREAFAVALETALILRRQLRLCRAAYGGGIGLGVRELIELVDGLPAGGRARLEVALPDDAEFPPGASQVLLVAILVAGEALPRGGTIRVAGDARTGVALLPEGRNAAWPKRLAAELAAVAGHGAAPPEAGPREVLPVLLARLAHAAGIGLSLALGAAEGPGVLLLEGPSLRPRAG
ncbi:histidine phosphotransferase family protein [Roseomonas sp. NAR14]|uniref:Histidine phosphotransferase family protein n=1 Tax=Roseomonas acroporae TaxID=2937791 RepID=A0A9X2BYU5_9PROT|nr:histidine phosphotransferase family protein [Roseomonas acroporae]MCK8786405.1 histidine phosphotransferase family protein [Roseomonas acroporae]